MFRKITDRQIGKVSTVKSVEKSALRLRFDSGSVKGFSEQRNQSRLFVRAGSATIDPSFDRHLQKRKLNLKLEIRMGWYYHVNIEVGFCLKLIPTFNWTKKSTFLQILEVRERKCNFSSNLNVMF
jgi:hypothetical protein